MTVNKSTTSTTKTKKKSTVQQSSNVSATSSTSTTKKTTTSKSSTGCNLQISDVTHLPEASTSSAVEYSVTESFPHGGGESVTTYNPSGDSSVEYRHFINQDSSSIQKSSNITQVSSILHQSNTNLSTFSDDSTATYVVTEPKDELRYSHNKNDSGWNGKFIMEQQPPSAGSIVEQSSSTYSHQESSSIQKNSSSSCATEIIDGKGRVVDQKHSESGFSTRSKKNERSSSRSGTHVAPESHYLQEEAHSSTVYDTDLAELKTPQTQSSASVKEYHKVGDCESKTIYKTQDGRRVEGAHRAAKILGDDINSDSAFVLEKSHAESNKEAQASLHSANFYGQDTQSSKYTNSKNFHKLGSDVITTTTTTTYYDSEGNVVNVITDVEDAKLSGTNVDQQTTKTKSKEKLSSERIVIEGNTSSASTTSYGATSEIVNAANNQNVEGMHKEDSIITTTTTCYDSEGRVVNVDTQRERISGPPVTTIGYDSHTKTTNVEDINKTSTSEGLLGPSPFQVTNLPDPSFSSHPQRGPSSTNKNSFAGADAQGAQEITTTTTTYYDSDGKIINVVEDNNISKVRNSQTTTDSRNFYGHDVDSRSTIVKNVYDTTATQNTIGVKGKILKDNTIVDSANVVYSNDRNYGKSSWNGQFVYEKPLNKTQNKDTARDVGKKSKSGDVPSSPRTLPQGPKTTDTFFNIERFETTKNDKINKTNKTKGETARPQKFPQGAPSEIVETCEISSGSKTTLDSQRFVDNKTSFEYYTSTEGPEPYKDEHSRGPYGSDEFKGIPKSPNDYTGRPEGPGKVAPGEERPKRPDGEKSDSYHKIHQEDHRGFVTPENSSPARSDDGPRRTDISKRPLGSLDSPKDFDKFEDVTIDVKNISVTGITSENVYDEKTFVDIRKTTNDVTSVVLEENVVDVRDIVSFKTRTWGMIIAFFTL